MKKRVKNHKKHLFKEVDQVAEDMRECRNTKTVHEFHPCLTASIKAVGVKEYNEIVPFTRFSTGKMLMFAKLSLMSFIYELSETFMFPSVQTKAIYDIYSIDFVYVYQLLSDMDRTSLQFIFFSKDESRVPEQKFRDIIFLVIINSPVLERFDVSHEFWEQLGSRKKNTGKQLGLYDIEHTEDPCLVTIATNPKEYIEYFQSQDINKRIRELERAKIA